MWEATSGGTALRRKAERPPNGAQPVKHVLFEYRPHNTRPRANPAQYYTQATLAGGHFFVRAIGDWSRAPSRDTCGRCCEC